MNEGLATFFKGAVLRFSIAAPVGPIGVLCFRRTPPDGVWLPDQGVPTYRGRG